MAMYVCCVIKFYLGLLTTYVLLIRRPSISVDNVMKPVGDVYLDIKSTRKAANVCFICRIFSDLNRRWRKNIGHWPLLVKNVQMKYFTMWCSDIFTAWCDR